MVGKLLHLEGYIFCWNVSSAELRINHNRTNRFLLKFSVFLKCLEEAHRPVDCDTVAKWILKNSAESENMNW